MESVRSLPAAVVVAGLLSLLLGAFFGAIPAAAHETDGDQDARRINLVHGVPELPLDLEIGRDRRLKGLDFGVVFPFGSFAGQRVDLVFKRSGTDEVVLTARQLALPADDRYTLLVRRRIDGSLALTTFVNTMTPIGPDQTRLIIRNLRSDRTVEVILDGEQVMGGVAAGEERLADVAVGETVMTVADADADADAGGDGEAVLSAPLALTAGDAVVVYILDSGSPTDAGDGSPMMVTETLHDLDVDAALMPDPSTAGGGRSLHLVTGPLAALALLATGVFLARRMDEGGEAKKAVGS